jgi:hypothetical protein
MSSFATTIAEAAALQAATAKMLTEICELQTQVAAVKPLIQEFRASTAIAVAAARSVPPCPAHMAYHIVTACSSMSGSSGRPIQIPQ